MLRLLLILACSLLPLAALPRAWKSPSGDRTFQGNFVARDAKGVTIRRADGQVFTLAATTLHPDDLKWLDQTHPLTTAPPADPPAAPPADQSAVFDTLHFGDTRAQVQEKLKASSFVEMGVDAAFLGRMGLNGTFQTRKDIGGLRCLLYFDWTAAGAMNEFSLQTSPLPAADYPTRVKTCWTELIKLLTTLYGQPVQNAGYPLLEQLSDGSFLASHLWQLEGGGSVRLGSAREGDTYTAVVRFTQRELSPVVLP